MSLTTPRATPAGKAAATHAARLKLASIARAPWEALCVTAIEPNVFFDPGFAIAATSLALGGKGADALVAFDGANRQRIMGLLPVVSAWQAYKLPVPALVALQPYSPLSTPLLDRDDAIAAAGALIDGAAAAGASLLVLPAMALDGPAAAAMHAALAERGLRATTDRAHGRAAFDATTGDVDSYLRAGMGAKKLKELRRLRHRMDDDGTVALTIASTPATLRLALDRFLELEARGWKGNLGTGLAQAQGDAAFIHAAAADLGARGAFDIAELTLDGTTVAAGLVLAQGDRAFFLKIAYDETMSRVSPGVQLTLDLTRHFAGNPALALVDSTADAGHPMIDHVWRERLAIGDLLVPTRAGPLGAALAGLVIGRRQARDAAKRLRRFARTFREKTS